MRRLGELEAEIMDCLWTDEEVAALREALRATGRDGEL